MPKILESAKSKLVKKGYSISAAYAIATHALQTAGYLKRGTNRLTKKGRSKR